MLDIYYKYVAGENISKDDLTKANEQLKDILKGIGALGIFALPGGILAIISRQTRKKIWRRYSS